MVSVVILSYNTKELLQKCLTSVFSVLKSETIEVIVLDNASSDGSVAMVKEQFQQVHLIESPENLGFAKGINKAAKEANGDYLLFLNSDTVLTSDVLGEMVAYMEGGRHIGALGGRLLQKEEATSESYGEFPTVMRVISLLFLPKRKNSYISTPLRVDWVSGGFMLIPKKLFDEMEGFDENFFMYMEDMELCFRLSRKGYQAVYYPQATAMHVGQGSSNRSFAIIHIAKGLQYFFKKHMSPWSARNVKLLFLCKAIILLALGYITKNDYLYQTYRSVYKTVL